MNSSICIILLTFHITDLDKFQKVLFLGQKGAKRKRERKGDRRGGKKKKKRKKGIERGREEERAILSHLSCITQLPSKKLIPI